MLKNSKRSIIISLVVIMTVLFACSFSYADLVFPGQPRTPFWSNASSWAIEELEKCSSNSLIPLSFKGKDFTKNVTREEFAEVSVKLYEQLTKDFEYKDMKNPFVDTTNDHVVKAYYVGITSGTSENTFSPNKEITREEMATMISRALQKVGINTKDYVSTSNVEFKDHSLMHDWSQDAIYFMANKNIIKGVGEGLFGVNDKATVEQALLISGRSLEAFKNGITISPIIDLPVVTSSPIIDLPVVTSSPIIDLPVVTSSPSVESVVAGAESSINSMALQAFNGKFERYFGEKRRQTVSYQLCDLITTNNAGNTGHLISIEFTDLDGQTKEVSDVAGIHDITSTIIKANNVKYDITGSYDDAGYLCKVTYKSVK